MRRLFFPFSGNSIVLDGEAYHHLVRVNRAEVEEEIEVADGQGRVVLARIASISEGYAELIVFKEIENKIEPLIHLVLGFGLLKGEKSDWLIQKATELGVGEIWPLALEHSVVKLDEKKGEGRRTRWQKIALEAAQQCGRDRVPIVKAPLKLSKALSNFGQDGIVIMPHEALPEHSLKRVLKTNKPVKDIFLIIGSEGGFSAEETKLAEEQGAKLVNLGPRILRAETAALAGAGMILYEWADLGGTQ